MSRGFWFDSGVANAQDIGSVTATSLGTSVASGSTANTKGAYTQLVASTTYDATWLILTSNGGGAGITTNLIMAVDVAIGASGSEQVILSNLVFLTSTDGPSINRVAIPCHIPAGSRIAIRSAVPLTGSITTYFNITLLDGSFTEPEALFVCDTYGFQSTGTKGTTLDPGTTANTKGAYAQLVASTSADIRGFFLTFDNQGYTATGSNTQGDMLIDLAIGASGSEQIIIPNMQVFNKTDHTLGPMIIVPNMTEFMPIQIPNGTRIAARCQSTQTTASIRLVGITLYGIRA